MKTIRDRSSARRLSCATPTRVYVLPLIVLLGVRANMGGQDGTVISQIALVKPHFANNGAILKRPVTACAMQDVGRASSTVTMAVAEWISDTIRFTYRSGTRVTSTPKYTFVCYSSHQLNVYGYSDGKEHRCHHESGVSFDIQSLEESEIGHLLP